MAYYSFGVLPTCLPLLTGKLLEIVVSETTRGKVNRTAATKEKA